MEKIFYRYFTPNGKEIKLHDTEDIKWWIEDGNRRENEFIEFCASKGILPGLSINPERDKNPGAPEYVFKGHYLDLKDHRTPFFEAQRFRNMPPRYAMTLDENDVEDIRHKYPDCLIVFYVKWEVKYQKVVLDNTGKEKIIREIAIEPLHGVWGMTPKLMFSLIKDQEVHRYARRINDQKGNARTSYGIDLRDIHELWIDPEYPPIKTE